MGCEDICSVEEFLGFGFLYRCEGWCWGKYFLWILENSESEIYTSWCYFQAIFPSSLWSQCGRNKPNICDVSGHVLGTLGGEWVWRRTSLLSPQWAYHRLSSALTGWGWPSAGGRAGSYSIIGCVCVVGGEREGDCFHVSHKRSWIKEWWRETVAETERSMGEEMNQWVYEKS